MPVAEEGAILYGLPIQQYHSGREVSNTGVSDFLKSPAHFYGLHIDPDRPRHDETISQLDGNLAHCAILEPMEFGNRYPVGPDCRRGTKAWDAFEATCAPGSTVIKPDQHARAWAQRAAVLRNPELAKLFGNGMPEVSAYWTDPATGIRCRVRPDWVHMVSATACIITDVKTCGSADPKEFARQIARMGYARQAAFYSDGFAAASGLEVLGFVFCAVEMAWPYACSAVMLDELSLEKGRSEIREALPRMIECQRTNVWPSYTAGIEWVSLPAWAL